MYATKKQLVFKHLTQSQKYVIQWMDDRNVGAVAFEGEYRFLEAFRRDARLAHRFYLKIKAE